MSLRTPREQLWSFLADIKTAGFNRASSNQRAGCVHVLPESLVLYGPAALRVVWIRAALILVFILTTPMQIHTDKAKEKIT